MSASYPILLLLLLVSLICLSPSWSSPHETSTSSIGFTTSLIHSNSPRSPLYKPNATTSDRIQAAVRRSLSRHRYFQSLINTDGASAPNEVQSPTRPHDGEYVMSYYIGTPPTKTFAIADTASDLIWLQCLPCDACFKQEEPIFDPMKSSTYTKIACEEPECHYLPTVRCNKDDKSCQYGVVYQDSSSTEGILSYETLTFGDYRPGKPPGNITLSNMIIGCSHKSSEVGNYDDNSPGIIGLNNRTLSLVSQLMMDEFSYCFVPANNVDTDSLMHFGLSAMIVGDTTPIVYVAGNDNDYYYLNLEGISLDNEKLPFPAGFFNATAEGEGGLIIDTGSTFTLLNSTALAMLIKGMVNMTSTLVPAEDTTEMFDLCYEATLEELMVAPDITFHFTGVDLELSQMSTWTENGHGLLCLAMLPTNGVSILGNYQQQNLNVGYNVAKRIVSFKPMDCTKT